MGSFFYMNNNFSILVLLPHLKHLRANSALLSTLGCWGGKKNPHPVFENEGGVVGLNVSDDERGSQPSKVSETGCSSRLARPRTRPCAGLRDAVFCCFSYLVLSPSEGATLYYKTAATPPEGF